MKNKRIAGGVVDVQCEIEANRSKRSDKASEVA
jgi:hypothetical protein